ncbi:MAG: iron-containing alcohol dehydrogenase [Propionibacteriaceae bacterium]|nr:iron-containing alcohol dehydrogenase [Propionibacteriaceae bacterium]
MFTFQTAGRIRFGAGVAAELASLTEGKRVFLVGGSDPGRYGLGLEPVASYRLCGEPTFSDARAAVTSCRESGADLVVGLGGGAVIDLAKAVSVLAAQDGDPLDYAEVIGAGRPLGRAKVSCVAVPTTAGTGAEVTANAVLTSPEHRVKVSLRASSMLPEVALVDPALTLTCPPQVSANSGMDALTQCLEPYVTPRASPLTDGFAREGMRRAHALTRVFTQPDDLEARTDMALCSLLGGLSLANSGLGAVHGFAGVLGGMTGAPHGAICAALLAPVTTANLSAMFSREPANPAIERYRDAALLLTGQRHTSALQEWLWELGRHLETPGLGSFGLSAADYAEAVRGAQRASSMRGNPIELTPAELRGILVAAA